MRWIYISPHFDDAVLSCGGLIAEQSRKGIQVEIWTICAGDAPEGAISNFAKKTHKDWGTGDARETVITRREEDREAARRVGAGIHHFDFPDCIYRQTPSGASIYTRVVFTPWNPNESILHTRIADSLREKLQKEDVLVCPLAIGWHVDHILTRMAVESLKLPIRYYADIPYLLVRPKSLQSVVAGLHEETFPISAECFHAWVEGISAYRSQIAGLFKTNRRMHVAMAKYWQSRHGVRLWRREAEKNS